MFPWNIVLIMIVLLVTLILFNKITSIKINGNNRNYLSFLEMCVFTLNFLLFCHT